MQNPIVFCGRESYPAGKILCVGRNYAEHARELGNEVPEFPLVFMKPASNLGFSGAHINKPADMGRLHYETELVLLLTKEIRNANEDECRAAIGGYSVGLDMTLRDYQEELKKKGYPWTLAKCFDDAAVVTDFIPVSEHQLTMNEEIRLKVNGELKQNAPLNLMIFGPVEIVKFLSHKMTLYPGDLIFTGTPAGVGATDVGDILEAEITGINSLAATIV